MLLRCSSHTSDLSDPSAYKPQSPLPGDFLLPSDPQLDSNKIDSAVSPSPPSSSTPTSSASLPTVRQVSRLRLKQQSLAIGTIRCGFPNCETRFKRNHDRWVLSYISVYSDDPSECAMNMLGMERPLICATTAKKRFLRRRVSKLIDVYLWNSFLFVRSQVGPPLLRFCCLNYNPAVKLLCTSLPFLQVTQLTTG